MACSACEGPISKTSRSGLCRACFNKKIGADPEVARRKSESLKRYCANPANAAAMRERGQRAAAKRLSDPVHLAWAQDFMRNVVQPLSMTPEELAKGHRSAAAKLSTEKRMAWCPVEYRDAYRALIRTGIKMAEARPMILETIALHRARAQARMSPFERQDANLRAKLERNDATPIASNDMFRRRAA